MIGLIKALPTPIFLNKPVSPPHFKPLGLTLAFPFLASSNSLDNLINAIKPTVFWKEKPLLKKQLSIWSLNNLKKIIDEINNIELLCKKNPQISKVIFFNFFSKIVTITSFISKNSGFLIFSGFDTSSVPPNNNLDAVFVDAYSVGNREAHPQGLAFNNDGTKMFVTGMDGDDVNAVSYTHLTLPTKA